MISSICKCGKIVALDRKLCPYCGKTMSSVEHGNVAEVLTHTTLFTVPEGFNSPIFLTLVKLENDAKLLCECKNENDLEIGRKGKVIFENEKYYFVSNKI
jgi:uncharacterized OB-fold protein